MVHPPRCVDVLYAREDLGRDLAIWAWCRNGERFSSPLFSSPLLVLKTSSLRLISPTPHSHLLMSAEAQIPPLPSSDADATGLLSLPPELFAVFETITSFLAPQQALQLSLTCRALYDMLPAMLPRGHFNDNAEPPIELAVRRVQQQLASNTRLRGWCAVGAVRLVVDDVEELDTLVRLSQDAPAAPAQQSHRETASTDAAGPAAAAPAQSAATTNAEADDQLDQGTTAAGRLRVTRVKLGQCTHDPEGAAWAAAAPRMKALAEHFHELLWRLWAAG